MLPKRTGFAILAAYMLTAFTFSANAADNATADVYELDTVVVTAEKRGRDIKEVPSAVSSLSGEEVDEYGLRTLADVMSMTPNLYVTQTGESITTFATMRGITGSMNQIPSVGFYVDDVYHPNLDVSFYDVERIEILKGPQGTLYGRNSEAGVINIVTKQPSDTWAGRAGIDISSFNTYETKASISGPVVSDRLFIKAAARYAETDGYFESVNGEDDLGKTEKKDGKFSLGYKSGNEFSADLSYGFQRYDGDKYANFAPLHGGSMRKNINVNEDGETYNDFDMLSLRGEYSAGDVKLVSVTAYSRSESMFMNDTDFTPIDMISIDVEKDINSFSQEFRLMSDNADGKLNWIAGLFLLSEKDERRYNTWMNFMNMGMGVPGENLRQNSETETTGIAVFGEAGYEFGSRLEVTAGLRYDSEKKEFGYNQTPSGSVLPMMGYGSISGSEEETYGAWLPKLSVKYRFTGELLTYASISRGFRSGGFNEKENMGSSFDPEYTWNYELGLKSSWLDRRLNFNAAVFHIDWKDMQVEIADASGTSVYMENAAEAESTGAEVEISAMPLSGLVVNAGAGYTYAEYKDYTKGDEDFSGNRVIDSPLYTANFGAAYRFGGGFYANTNYSYFGKVYFDPANSEEQKSYGVLNAKIGYQGSRYDIYLYGRNLLDEEYAVRAFEVNDVWYGRAGEPRVIGVAVAGRF
ncbi:TonB-dependent receptor [Geovibrio thiophilus]|uniref:TonB-dependent receptor n=1 Tax=Geovibrio thiophilus TaxID=139438 RepID=A0A3R5XY03_9BACT|nr:TonB-dependent receptor [Geovibrio thiophilus]QAR33512.1 TonB-dependent receptor [Geovibrio thiophilus]